VASARLGDDHESQILSGFSGTLEGLGSLRRHESTVAPRGDRSMSVLNDSGRRAAGEGGRWSAAGTTSL
jgi:hypothetical protein